METDVQDSADVMKYEIVRKGVGWADYIRGQAREPHENLFEISVVPNSTVPLHCHGSPEIIIVQEGVLFIGRGKSEIYLEAGDSIRIPGLTLYTLHTNQVGARYLNFRTCKTRLTVAQRRKLLELQYPFQRRAYLEENERKAAAYYRRHLK